MTRELDSEGTRSAAKVLHKRNDPWSKELRIAVARAVVEQGQSTFSVAPKFGVPYTTAILWARHRP
jgi:transposase-like protein